MNNVKLKSSRNGRVKVELGFVQRAPERYGWYAFITGRPTFFGRTKAECSEWIRSKGCEVAK